MTKPTGNAGLPPLSNPAHSVACPACSHNVAVPFFRSTQPLATLAFPDTVEEAESLARHRLDFVRCVGCGHVFNQRFSYGRVPYAKKPNLMFNRSRNWSSFIRQARDTILSRLPSTPTVVEIGYGDGSFLAAMADGRPEGRCIGFDPHEVPVHHAGITFRAELFDPMVHIEELQPDVVISRHVLEHLTSPLSFLQRMSFACSLTGQSPLLYLEVPCIDNLLTSGRTVDLYYEHSSQFTTRSFTTMLTRSGLAIETIEHGYGGEVIYALARVAPSPDSVAIAEEAARYVAVTRRAKRTIGRQLDALCAAGKTLAIWGGTGKSAAFINHYGLDRRRFPMVVDSDPDKVDTHVPGAGQQIRFRDALLETPHDIILIPPQWRAVDILQEIRSVGIRFEQILIEHDGRLIDFLAEPHPYRAPD